MGVGKMDSRIRGNSGSGVGREGEARRTTRFLDGLGMADYADRNAGGGLGLGSSPG